jgi:hypothetical protein
MTPGFFKLFFYHLLAFQAIRLQSHTEKGCVIHFWEMAYPSSISVNGLF